MESTRQQRINRLLQKELGDIFLLDAKNMPGVLVTVSEVRVSLDLSFAKVFLSIFPSDKGKTLIKNITSNSKAIRYDLGTRIGKQVRIIPELAFSLDTSLDYLERIDTLLNEDKGVKNNLEDTEEKE